MTVYVPLCGFTPDGKNDWWPNRPIQHRKWPCIAHGIKKIIRVVYGVIWGWNDQGNDSSKIDQITKGFWLCEEWFVCFAYHVILRACYWQILFLFFLCPVINSFDAVARTRHQAVSTTHLQQELIPAQMPVPVPLTSLLTHLQSHQVCSQASNQRTASTKT